MRYSFLRPEFDTSDIETNNFINNLCEPVKDESRLIEQNCAVLEEYLNVPILPKNIDFEGLFITAMEASINGKERSDLPDSAFGLPKKRQYPLVDESLVRNAIKYFKFCGKKDRKELADNIIAAAKKFKMRPVITPHNPLRDYINEKDFVIGTDGADVINKDKDVDKNKFNTNPALEAEAALTSKKVRTIKKSTSKKITEYFVSGESIYREPKGEEVYKNAHAYTKVTSGTLGNIVKSIELFNGYSSLCSSFVKKFNFCNDDFVNGLSKADYDKYKDAIETFKLDMKSLEVDKAAMIKKSDSGAIVNINRETAELYIKCIQSANSNISNILDILLDGDAERTLNPKSMYFSDTYITAAKSINDIAHSITKNFR